MEDLGAPAFAGEDASAGMAFLEYLRLWKSRLISYKRIQGCVRQGSIIAVWIDYPAGLLELDDLPMDIYLDFETHHPHIRSAFFWDASFE